MFAAEILRALMLWSLVASATKVMNNTGGQARPHVLVRPDITPARAPEVCPTSSLEQEPTLLQHSMRVVHPRTSGRSYVEGMTVLARTQVLKRHVRFGSYELTTEPGCMSDLGRKIMLCICILAPAMLVLYGMGIYACSGDGCASLASEAGGHNTRQTCTGVRYLQASLYTFGVMFTGTLSVVIPDSYQLALDVGQGAVFSGFLIGAPTALSVFSILAAGWLMEPWNQRSMRCVSVCGACLGSLLALAFALGANPPGVWHPGNGPRMVVIMASRLAVGLLVSAVGPILRIMTQKVTPAREWMMLNVYRVTFVAVGIGGGPLLATGINHIMGASGVRERSAWPLLAMSLMWAALALAFYVLMPTSIIDLVSLKEDADKCEVPGNDHAKVVGVATNVVTAEATFRLRRSVWTLALVYGTERALIVAALEASTSLILQLEFGCDSSDIGLMIGASFLLGAPASVFMMIVRRRGIVSDTGALCGFATICLAATVLFLIGQNMWLFFIADTMIFPSGYLANGIVDGFSTQYAMEDTYYNQKNAAVLGTILRDTTGRFIGPPVARFIAHLGGRKLYGQIQMVMCAISLVTAWKLASVVQNIHQHEHSGVSATNV